MAKKNPNKNLENNTKCAVCPLNSNTICSGCNKVIYCSKEHQKLHFDEHKIVCRPYEVKSNNVLGRYLSASKDIKKGELILKDTPIAVGPSTTSHPVCLKCYNSIPPSKKQIFCLKCAVAPLCSLTCSATGHSNFECETFKTNIKITPSVVKENPQIILPLRCLFLRKGAPEIWGEFVKMEAHVTQRKETFIWKSNQKNIVEIINQFNLLSKQDINSEILQQICGVLDVNSFEIRAPGCVAPTGSIRGVFINAALMAHDCIGNTHLAVDDNFNMSVHASVNITKGDTILYNYTNALQGTFERQEHLQEGKYFKCNCSRCIDATECGTYMSSIICVKCKTGLVCPNKIVDDLHNKNTIWKCSKCSFQCFGSLINATVNSAKDLIEETDKTDVRNIEKLLKKMLNTFTPTHSIILDLKQMLVGLYTEILRQEANPNRKYLHRKLELCQEILPVLETVEPGISRLTGITLYEMHIPMVIIANREYDNKEISAEELLKKVLQAEEVLKKAISNLLYEPTGSPEGRLTSNALNELKLLRKSIKSVELIVENKKLNVEKRRKNKK